MLFFQSYSKNYHYIHHMIYYYHIICNFQYSFCTRMLFLCEICLIRTFICIYLLIINNLKYRLYIYQLHFRNIKYILQHIFCTYFNLNPCKNSYLVHIKLHIFPILKKLNHFHTFRMKIYPNTTSNPTNMHRNYSIVH